jgi:hypothetical protein
MSGKSTSGTNRLTPNRPLTLNLSADEREELVTALTIGIDNLTESQEQKKERLEHILSKTVQEGVDKYDTDTEQAADGRAE